MRESILSDHLPNYPALWELNHADYKNKHLIETMTSDRNASSGDSHFEGILFLA
jgi:hypothetical protein